MNFWQILVALIQSIFTATKGLTPVSMPTATTITTATPAGPVTTTVQPTLRDKLITLISHFNGPAGPLPRTGGQTFQNTDAQTASLADAIIAAQNLEANVTVQLLTALTYDEAKGSVLGINPNLNKVPVFPQTAADLVDHGPFQINASEFDSYPDLKSMSLADQIATVCDPTWSAPVASGILATHLAWAAKQDAAIRAIAGIEPTYGGSGNPAVLGMEAYNTGPSGAAIRAILQHLDIMAIDTNGNIVSAVDATKSTQDHTYELAAKVYGKGDSWPNLVASFKSGSPDSFSYGNSVWNKSVEFATTLGVA